MGVMGFVEMLYMLNTVHDQPQRIANGMGSFLYRLQLETDLTATEYIQRPIWMANYAPGFTIPGKRARKLVKTDALISLPMYAKYAKLRIDQIPMTRLLLDMHEPYNRSHIKFLKDSIQSLLDSDGLKDQYKIFAYQDILDNSSKVSSLQAQA